MSPNISKEALLTSMTYCQKTTLPTKLGGSLFEIIQSNKINPNLQEENGSFRKMLLLIGANYSIDLSNSKSPNFLKLQMIYDECLNRNWSVEFFDKHLRKFLLENEYPNFNIAMFFKNSKEPKLRTHSEYLKTLNEIGESLNNEVIRFLYEGYYLWCYKNEITQEQIDILNLNTKRFNN